MMKTLQVKTGRPYEIRIERGCLNRCGTLARNVSKAQKAAVITDSNVGPLYAKIAAVSLEKAGFCTFTHVFPPGESSKVLGSISDMLSFLAGNAFTRGDLIVALGGGVTGDMAGFAASIYMRGIDYIQIPTSLLAQIDSSVGGKTAVDLPQGKNLCGAFWQPRLVLIDPELLSTLPPRFFADGMAEAIKYGCIDDAPLFDRLERETAGYFLEEMIFSCVDSKRRIVEEDERESGRRMLLNFGHTLGHALEKYGHFAGYSHGEAVGIGMLLACAAGERNGLTQPGTCERIRSLLEKYRLPIACDAPLGTLLQLAASDKKRAGDSIHFILLRKIGESFTLPLSLEQLPSFFGCDQSIDFYKKFPISG